MADRTIELILEARDQASQTVNRVRREFKGMESDIKLAAKAATVAWAATTAAGAFAVKTASDAQVPWARLAQQLRNAGVDFSQVRGQIEATARELQDFTRFGDEDTAAVLGELVGITNDYAKSLGAIETVYDVAIAKQLDFSTSAQLIGRVMSGDTQMLTRYGIVIEEGADAMEVLRQRFGGMARNDGRLAAAQFVQIRNEVGDLVEEFGLAVIGGSDLQEMLTLVRDELKDATQWVEENRESIEEWVGAAKQVSVTAVNVAGDVGEWVVEHKELLIELAKFAVLIRLTQHTLAFARAMTLVVAATRSLAITQAAANFLRLAPAIRSAADAATLARMSFGTAGLAGLLTPAGALLVGLGALAFILTRVKINAREAAAELREINEAIDASVENLPTSASALGRAAVEGREIARIRQQLTELRRQRDQQISDRTTMQGTPAGTVRTVRRTADQDVVDEIERLTEEMEQAERGREAALRRFRELNGRERAARAGSTVTAPPPAAPTSFERQREHLQHLLSNLELVRAAGEDTAPIIRQLTEMMPAALERMGSFAGVFSEEAAQARQFFQDIREGVASGPPSSMELFRSTDADAMREFAAQQFEEAQQRNRQMLEAAAEAAEEARKVHKERVEAAQEIGVRFAQTFTDSMTQAAAATIELNDAVQQLGVSLLRSLANEAVVRGASAIVGAMMDAGDPKARKIQSAAGTTGGGLTTAGAAVAGTGAGLVPGLVMMGAGLGLSLLSGFLGRDDDKEEQREYRAHLRALRDARREEQLHVQLVLPDGMVDFSDPRYQESLAEGIDAVRGNRVGNTELVSRGNRS